MCGKYNYCQCAEQELPRTGNTNMANGLLALLGILRYLYAQTKVALTWKLTQNAFQKLMIRLYMSIDPITISIQLSLVQITVNCISLMQITVNCVSLMQITVNCVSILRKNIIGGIMHIMLMYCLHRDHEIALGVNFHLELNIVS